MGGFKSGAADDDWGDAASTPDSGSAGDSEQEGDSEPGRDSDPERAETEAASGAPADERFDGSGDRGRDGGSRSARAGTPGDSPRATGTDAQPQRRDLPWTLTRNSITDGRDQTVQLHLQRSTVEAQREAARTLEAELGETVKKADLREAALLVGLERLDEVAATLREWGYDLD